VVLRGAQRRQPERDHEAGTDREQSKACPDKGLHGSVSPIPERRYTTPLW